MNQTSELSPATRQRMSVELAKLLWPGVPVRPFNGDRATLQRGTRVRGVPVNTPFNPFEQHADAQALVRWLTGQPDYNAQFDDLVYAASDRLVNDYAPTVGALLLTPTQITEFVCRALKLRLEDVG